MRESNAAMARPAYRRSRRRRHSRAASALMAATMRSCNPAGGSGRESVRTGCSLAALALGTADGSFVIVNDTAITFIFEYNTCAIPACLGIPETAFVGMYYLWYNSCAWIPQLRCESLG